MVSKLIKLSTPITVTFAPEKVYDPNTGGYITPEGGGTVLEVFLLRDNNPRGTEQQGLDVTQSSRLMQIVRTEGDAPLKLPDSLKAGDTGTFTDMGREQTLTLGSLVPTQIPKVAAKLGWVYLTTVEGVG